MTSKTGRRALFGAAFFLLGCIAGLLAGGPGEDFCVLSLTIEADRPVETQLFYDTGRDFNEEASQRVFVYRTGEPVTLSFPLPAGALRRLRFDPARGPASICIGRAVLDCGEGRSSGVRPEAFVPHQGIRPSPRTGEGLCVETVGEDPVWILDGIGKPALSWVPRVLQALAGGVLALAGAFFGVWLYKAA